jgi:hypothetical protein
LSWTVRFRELRTYPVRGGKNGNSETDEERSLAIRQQFSLLISVQPPVFFSGWSKKTDATGIYLEDGFY